MYLSRGDMNPCLNGIRRLPLINLPLRCSPLFDEPSRLRRDGVRGAPRSFLAGAAYSIMGWALFTVIIFSILALSKFCFPGRQKSVGRQTSSFAIFGFSVGLCELQMCLAACVGSYSFINLFVNITSV